MAAPGTPRTAPAPPRRGAEPGRGGDAAAVDGEPGALVPVDAALRRDHGGLPRSGGRRTRMLQRWSTAAALPNTKSTVPATAHSR